MTVAGQLHYAFTSHITNSPFLAFLSWEAETDLSPNPTKFPRGGARSRCTRACTTTLTPFIVAFLIYFTDLLGATLFLAILG
jgi:hypothetical protein